ncbi:hypothetical protein ACFQXA_33570 [Nocardiopsis composta]
MALPYANTPDGPTGEQVRLYAVTVPVDPDRKPTGIELPSIEGGARMHVFDLGVRKEQRDWTGTWSASTSGYAEVGPWEDQTVRLAVRTGAGGPDTRLHLDNVFAAEPVEIGAVTVALRDEGPPPCSGRSRWPSTGSGPRSSRPAAGSPATRSDSPCPTRPNCWSASICRGGSRRRRCTPRPPGPATPESRGPT